MKNVREFRIEFERLNATYSPGEIVSGRILLILSGSMNVREIGLEAKGRADIQLWHSSHAHSGVGVGYGYFGRGYYPRHHHLYRHHHIMAAEDFFRVFDRLVGGSGKITLPAGQHYFPFSFHLPNNLPPSYEFEFGHISYTVKAILKVPWRFKIKSEFPITVIALHDLNNLPANVTAGINDEINRNFSCSCCIDIGSAKVNVRSRVSGFVTGETIELTVNYDNDSTKVNLTKIKMQLERRLKLYSSMNTRCSLLGSHTKVVRVIENRLFNKNGEAVLRFDVPALPPSNLSNCKILKIKYVLVVKIGVSGMRFNIKRTYPIEIGTVPVRRS